MLAKHEEQAESLKGKIAKVRDELEVKRDMKREEERLEAEQDRLNKEKGELKKKAEERLLEEEKLEGGSIMLRRLR